MNTVVHSLPATEDAVRFGAAGALGEGLTGILPSPGTAGVLELGGLSQGQGRLEEDGEISLENKEGKD